MQVQARMSHQYSRAETQCEYCGEKMIHMNGLEIGEADKVLRSALDFHFEEKT